MELSRIRIWMRITILGRIRIPILKCRSNNTAVQKYFFPKNFTLPGIRQVAGRLPPPMEPSLQPLSRE